MKAKTISKITVFLLLTMFVLGRTSLVKAADYVVVPDIDEGHGCSITISLSYKDDAGETVMLSDVSMQLYQVAEVSVKNGVADYVLTKPFSKTGINLNKMTTEQSKEYAAKLYNAVKSDRIKGEVKTTDAQGKVSFTENKAGMYLAVMQDKKDDAKEVTYKTAPFLIMAPAFDDEKGAWSYERTIEPKFLVQAEDNKVTVPTPAPTNIIVPSSNPEPYTGPGEQIIIHTPKTGDDTNAPLWWCLFLGSLIGIILLVLPMPKRHKSKS